MSFITFVAYAIIAFGSHFFMYKRLYSGSEVMSRLNILYGVASFLASHFLRIVLSGFLFVPQRPVIDAATGEIDWILALIHFLLSFVDIWSMIIFLKRVSRGSLRDRALNLGLGWAIFDTFSMRVPGLWAASRSIDWSFAPVLVALGATASLFTVMGVARLAARIIPGKMTVQGSVKVTVAVMMIGLGGSQLIGVVLEGLVQEYAAYLKFVVEIVIAVVVTKFTGKVF